MKFYLIVAGLITVFNFSINAEFSILYDTIKKERCLGADIYTAKIDGGGHIICEKKSSHLSGDDEIKCVVIDSSGKSTTIEDSIKYYAILKEQYELQQLSGSQREKEDNCEIVREKHL